MLAGAEGLATDELEGCEIGEGEAPGQCDEFGLLPAEHRCR
jgi:hypothetical protein